MRISQGWNIFFLACFNWQLKGETSRKVLATILFLIIVERERKIVSVAALGSETSLIQMQIFIINTGSGSQFYKVSFQIDVNFRVPYKQEKGPC